MSRSCDSNLSQLYVFLWTDDMSEDVSSRKRSQAFNFFGWFGKASQRAVQVMKSFVSCTSLRSDDSFAEYLARILGEPNSTVSEDSRDASPSACSTARDACSSSKSDDSFSHFFTNVLRDPSPLCLRGGEDQSLSIGSVPLKACSSSKSNDSLTEYLTTAIRAHNRLDFRDSRDETLSTCSIPRDACSSPKSDASHTALYLGSTKRDVGSRGRSLSTCSIPEEATPRLGYVTPPDVWSNRNGGKSPVGFVGKLDATTSNRLAAICQAQKSHVFERPLPTTEVCASCSSQSLA